MLWREKEGGDVGKWLPGCVRDRVIGCPDV